MASQKYPICGIQVDEQSAAGQSQHQGQTYYFCSQSCKQKFDQNPQQYASGSEQSQSSGTSR